MKKTIIIIGGGLGGLAAAALLSKNGHNVTLLEKNPTLGGRARVYKDRGFTFDMGPSWYLMPDIFERFFAMFGKKPQDYMELIRLDPQYKIFYEDGSSVKIGTDFTENAKVFDSLEPGSSEKLKKYFAKTTKLYETATKGERGFLYKHFKRITDFIDTKLFELVFIVNIFRSYDSFVSDYTKNEKIRQILEYATVFLGGSPTNIPAVYSMMSHVDFTLGGWYPMGGIGKIADSLYELGLSNGVKFITDCNVMEIGIKNNKAQKVLTTKGEFAADIIVSNADIHHTETSLIKDKKNRSYDENYWSKQIMSPGTFLIYLGVNGRVQKLEHHNIFMIEDWEKHFNTIFKSPKWPEKASYYVCCPTITDSSVAPPGDENIFVLVPVAVGLDDTDVVREKFADKIISHLEEKLHTNIRDRIISKRIYSHRDFIHDYNAYKGTAFAPAHTLWQSVYFRPKMKSKKVDNYYHVGQYTQPGIGMPMVLLSAEFLTKEIGL